MGLQQLERRLERLFEGVFAKAFRSGLQPVEIGRRLTREMDLRRTVAPRGRLAPNEFTVAVSPDDYDRFAGMADELIDELIDVAKQHARDENYKFIGPVRIILEEDPDLAPGMLFVAGRLVRTTEEERAAVAAASDLDPVQPAVAPAEPSLLAPVAAPEPTPAWEADRPGGRRAGVKNAWPAARVRLPDGRYVPLGRRPFTIGRLPECDLALADANVSRRHAEISLDEDTGQFVIHDLNSTNGTRVNGQRLFEPQWLQSGDEITVGATALRFEME